MKICLHLVTVLASAVLMGTVPDPVRAQDPPDPVSWPLEFTHERGTVVIYQPQLEAFAGDLLSSRAAVSVKSGENPPVFGAVWLDARVSTDRDTRTIDLVSVTVSEAKFPEATADQIAGLKSYLQTEIPKIEMRFSLDQILAELDRISERQAKSEALNNTPPRIIIAHTPAVLVSIDGEPIFARGSESDLESVVNTAFVIVRDGKTLYLRGGEHWYKAPDVTADWQLMTSPPPRNVVTYAEKIGDKTTAPEGEEDEQTQEAPTVVIATGPAELIQIDGDAKMIPIAGTELLYVENTESDVIMDIASQSYYVLLAGRWYAATNLEEGPWAFVGPDALPSGFADIPADSDIGNVRVSVAGTEEARDAVLEQSIPQTATVDRNTATLDVTYDGEPKFEPIPETGMSYAVNTDKSVLFIDTRYYCCDDAVWFVADKPTGPWAVCVDVPGEVQDIPPESPVYNVKYVYVYDSTPTVVYVGYYPGYGGAYVWGGCVVYGTGYYYQPWYHTVYYPRPVTYGFGVHYNPWTGWGFSVGVSYGWFNVRVTTYHGGYWGPAGYHHGYRHGYNSGYAHGYHQGARAGYAAGRHAGQSPNNVYKNRPSGVKSTGNAARQPTTQPAGGRQAAKPSTKPNNVYADKNGNAYSRDSSGSWQQQQNNRSGGQSGGNKQQMDRSKQQDLNRQHQSREKGNNRSQQQRSGGKRR